MESFDVKLTCLYNGFRNTDEITSERIEPAKVFVITGPTEKFSVSEVWVSVIAYPFFSLMLLITFLVKVVLFSYLLVKMVKVDIQQI